MTTRSGRTPAPGFGTRLRPRTALAVDGTTYYAGDCRRRGLEVDRRRQDLGIDLGRPGVAVDRRAARRAATTRCGSAPARRTPAADSYRGIGVFRSTNGGASFSRVGGNELVDHTDLPACSTTASGHVYAATNAGPVPALRRHRERAVVAACSSRTRTRPTRRTDTSFITDVAVQPGTHGKTVLAVLGWRGGTPYNGFYLSTTGGGAGSFQQDHADRRHRRRRHRPHHARLFRGRIPAVRASSSRPKLLNAGEDTVLQGVFVSANGDPAGPYTKIAGSDSLGNSGSALQDLPGYHVGIQAWYNQALARRPGRPAARLRQPRRGLRDPRRRRRPSPPPASTGTTAWPAAPPARRTTHPDQHALALTANRQVVIANDGGVYSRPMSATGYGHWADLNATLRTLQYYDAAAGRPRRRARVLGWPAGQRHVAAATERVRRTSSPLAVTAAWCSSTRPTAPAGSRRVHQPRDVPHQRRRAHLHDASARSAVTTPTTSTATRRARFIAPFQADVHDLNHWVAAGNDVWDTTKGWPRLRRTTCDWVHVHELRPRRRTGGYNVGTARRGQRRDHLRRLGRQRRQPVTGVPTGIDTNYGGSWHRSPARCCRTGSSPVSPSTRPTLRTSTPSSTATRGAGSPAAASAPSSSPPTADPPGTTSPATCPTRRVTAWPSSAARWCSAPTSACSSRPAPHRSAGLASTACPTRRGQRPPVCPAEPGRGRDARPRHLATRRGIAGVWHTTSNDPRCDDKTAPIIPDL